MQKTQETLGLSLDWEDPLEEEMATHSSILAWKNPMGGGAWRATVHQVTKSWTRLSMQTHLLTMWQCRGVQVPSLLGEQRPHMPHGQKKVRT